MPASFKSSTGTGNGSGSGRGRKSKKSSLFSHISLSGRERSSGSTNDDSSRRRAWSAEIWRQGGLRACRSIENVHCFGVYNFPCRLRRRQDFWKLLWFLLLLLLLYTRTHDSWERALFESWLLLLCARERKKEIEERNSRKKASSSSLDFRTNERKESTKGENVVCFFACWARARSSIISRRASGRVNLNHNIN